MPAVTVDTAAWQTFLLIILPPKNFNQYSKLYQLDLPVSTKDVYHLSFGFRAGVKIWVCGKQVLHKQGKVAADSFHTSQADIVITG